MKYNHKEIEKKWNEEWFESNLYSADDYSSKPKKYILAEFPYPSGTRLHAGHVMRYTVPDIYARKLRMEGYNVLFPIGWDAFGLPAENYAVKTGIHPKETTQNAIEHFKRQMREVGFGFDWAREISTIEPEYYKWTQWLFLKFWEHGLAEEKEESVWWSEKLKSVLANEEVIKDENGNMIAERDDSPVERRKVKQWVLKIPQYADKLIEGLGDTDFPESVKTAQINWIGRSEGAEVIFRVKNEKKHLDVEYNNSEGFHERINGSGIKIFTTRIDTIFSGTYLILAPEHPMVDPLTTSEHKREVEDYVVMSKNKSELERTALQKEKTGVFTGSYAINPATGQEVPIWISDFVLVNYRTGAVFADAHDERDFELAKKYGIPLKASLVPSLEEDNSKILSLQECFEGEGILINSEQFNGLSSVEARPKIISWLESKGLAKKKVNFKLRDWLFSRQRYWGEPIPLIHKNDGTVEAVCNTNDQDDVERNLPLLLPNVPDYAPASDATSPLAKNEHWVNTTAKDGSPAKRETNTMPNWAGSCWYYLRYTDPRNNDTFADFAKMKYWLPVDRYFGGSEHTTLHLLYSRFWHKFFYDLGLVPTPEPYQWRMNGGILLGLDGNKMSKSKGNVINPDEKIERYGADALRLYINFMGPYDATTTWLEGGLKACRRLVNDIYELKDKVDQRENDQKFVTQFNRTVKNVSQMVDDLKTNTAVSEFMIFISAAKKQEFINKKIWKEFIKLIAPFAPFIAEELWFEVNEFKEWKKENSVHLQKWPKYNERLIQSEVITIGVQINGKTRSEVTISINQTEESVKEKVMNDENIRKWLEGKEVKKFIYVKGKILNIVV